MAPETPNFAIFRFFDPTTRFRSLIRLAHREVLVSIHPTHNSDSKSTENLGPKMYFVDDIYNPVISIALTFPFPLLPFSPFPLLPFSPFPLFPFSHFDRTSPARRSPTCTSHSTAYRREGDAAPPWCVDASTEMRRAG